MDGFIGRKCKIHIKIGESNLFYTGTILSMNDFQITFSDRHSDIYLFQTKDVVEIHDARLHKDKVREANEKESEEA